MNTFEKIKSLADPDTLRAEVRLDTGTVVLDWMIEGHRWTAQYDPDHRGVYAIGTDHVDALLALREPFQAKNVHGYPRALTQEEVLQDMRGERTPENDWPALPEGLPPVPEGFVYVGRGGELEARKHFRGRCIGLGDAIWADETTWWGASPGRYYACHRDDLHLITRKGGAA